MRGLVFFCCAVVATSLLGFDAKAWLKERNNDAELKRLRKAYATYAPKVLAPAENVVLPLETHPDGSLKSRLKAAMAYIFPTEGFIWAKGVRVEQYAPGGRKVEGFVTAASCIVDRNKSTGWVEGDALLKWGDSTVRGKGVFFDFKREFVKITSRTHIITKDVGKTTVVELSGMKTHDATKPSEAKPRKPAQGTASANTAHISSVRMDYDHKQGVVLFDRHVYLHDPEYIMHAQRMFLFLQGTNSLERIVAMGNVAMTNDARRAYCARATYHKRDARIILYGAPNAKAQLREEKRGKGTADTVLKGDRIIYWTDTEQAQVDGPEIEMPTGGGKSLREFAK